MKIAAVIQAAGCGSRFSEDTYKLLVPINGIPLIRHTVLHALEADYCEIAVVLGFRANETRETLKDLPVTLCENPDWKQGQASSMICGIRALRSVPDAIAFPLGDQPYVSGETMIYLNRITEMYPDLIIVPCYQGQRGNPCIFPKSVFKELLTSSGDHGGKKVLTNHSKVRVDINSNSILKDIDHINDLL